jgi:hypothetical protein
VVIDVLWTASQTTINTAVFRSIVQSQLLSLFKLLSVRPLGTRFDCVRSIPHLLFTEAAPEFHGMAGKQPADATSQTRGEAACASR